MKILEKLLAVLSSSTCRKISKLDGKNEKDLLLVDYLFKSKIFEHAAINGMKLIFPNADY